MVIRRSSGASEIASGEKHTWGAHRDVWAGLETRRGVIYCHGNNSNGLDPLNSSRIGQYPIYRGIEEVYVTCSADHGGESTWGNSTSVTRMGSTKTWLHTKGATAGKVGLIGVSMGGLTALNYAKANPSQVAWVVLILPVLNLTAIFESNRNGYAATINTAYGGVARTSGTTNGSPTITAAWVTAGDAGKAVYGTGIPARSKVGGLVAGVSFTLVSQETGSSVNATVTNASASLTVGGYHKVDHSPTLDPAIYASSLTVPVLGYYSSDDAVCLPAEATTFDSANALVEMRSVGALGHTETAIGAPPIADILSFINANWS